MSPGIREPFELTLAVAVSSEGKAITIRLLKTVPSGTVVKSGPRGAIGIAAKLALTDVVTLLQQLAGFDELGALQALGALVDFDPRQPPSTLDLLGQLPVTNGKR